MAYRGHRKQFGAIRRDEVGPAGRLSFNLKTFAVEETISGPAEGATPLRLGTGQHHVFNHERAERSPGSIITVIRPEVVR